MGTRENTLKNLREQNGCDLSQGQIAIAMGLNSADIITKFENGTTKSWDVLNFFRYCHVTDLDPILVFKTRYPDEPFSMKLLEEGKESVMDKEQIELKYEIRQEDIDRNKKNIVPNEIMEKARGNTIILGTSGSGKTNNLMYEILTAMRNGESAVAIMDKDDCMPTISALAEKTGHTVYETSAISNKIDWFSSINKTNSIEDFAKLATERIYPKETYDAIFRNACEHILVRCSKTFFTQYTERKTLKSFYEFIKTMPTEEFDNLADDWCSQKLIDTIREDLIGTIFSWCFGAEESAQSLDDIFKEKHVICLFGGDKDAIGQLPSLILEQYMRLIYRAKVSGQDNKYTIVIDELAVRYGGSCEPLRSWCEGWANETVKFVVSTNSMEAFRSFYGDAWKDATVPFNTTILLKGLQDAPISLGTNCYLKERFHVSLLDKFTKKKPLFSGLRKDIRTYDKIIFKDGKKPVFVNHDREIDIENTVNS